MGLELLRDMHGIKNLKIDTCYGRVIVSFKWKRYDWVDSPFKLEDIESIERLTNMEIKSWEIKRGWSILPNRAMLEIKLEFKKDEKGRGKY